MTASLIYIVNTFCWNLSNTRVYCADGSYSIMSFMSAVQEM